MIVGAYAVVFAQSGPTPATGQTAPATQAITSPLSPAPGTDPGAAVPASQLQALPIPERNWQEFLLETPATSSSESNDNASRSPVYAPGVLLDGVSVRLAFGNTSGSRARFPDGFRDERGGYAYCAGG